MTLFVRVDWLVELVRIDPKWSFLADRIRANNLIGCIPARHGEKGGGVEDTDLLVYVRDIKGAPPAFRFKGPLEIGCVNYPGSFKAMSEIGFLDWVSRLHKEGDIDFERINQILNAVQTAAVIKKICPNGHGEKEGYFCSVCGVRLVEVPTETGSSYKMFGNEKCPGCGYALAHGHQAFCPGCGRPLIWTCR